MTRIILVWQDYQEILEAGVSFNSILKAYQAGFFELDTTTTARRSEQC